VVVVEGKDISIEDFLVVEKVLKVRGALGTVVWGVWSRSIILLHLGVDRGQ
jgi:hypothetical protein